MYIQTPQLVIGPIGEADRANVIALLTDEVVAQTYMVPDFQSEEQKEKLFQRVLKLSHSDSFYQAGIFLNGGFIGLVNETCREGDSIEVGYAILPAYHNRGYGTEMLAAVMEKLFADGFGEIVAGAFKENAASLRIMEKCGMRRIDRTDAIEYRGKVHTCVYCVRGA